MSIETIWSRLTRVVVFLVLVAMLLMVGVWYLPLIRQNENMRKEALRLDGEIRKEEDKLHQKRISIEALRTDPKTVERLAREKLGLARNGETVIRFEEVATNAPALRQ
jgi:cell division protein FtsB